MTHHFKPAVVFLVIFAFAHASAHEPAEPPVLNTDGPVDLYRNLGDLTYLITTENEQAQRFFDQGLRLAYGFNFDESLRAFREAQRLDPECAMCAWGEGLVLGPNINAPMSEDAHEPALAAVGRAVALSHHGDAREQALVQALSQRYASTGPLPDKYAAAMAKVLEQFPADEQIAVLYVDAIMNTTPWNYWAEDGVTPLGQVGDAIAVVERLLTKNPNHPGAIHLYIHLTEASAEPERAEPYADRLPTLIPGAGHLVHMAGHTYFRIGRYDDSSRVNRAAVRVDEAYLAQRPVDNMYAWGYYPHNIHFVFTSAHLAGDAATAIDYAYRLEGKIPDEVAKKVGWIQVIKAAPYYTHADFSDPDTVLELSNPGETFPLVKAMWHYARGVAFARNGQVDLARTEAVQIAEIGRTADFSLLVESWVPGPDIVKISRHVLEGRIAQSLRDHERAVQEFEVAASIQDSLGYMEPPYWYYPVRQSLGAALLSVGKNDEAATAFESALEQFPRNGWALFGLMHSQQRLGDEAAAARTLIRFEQAWAGSPDAITLDRL